MFVLLFFVTNLLPHLNKKNKMSVKLRSKKKRDGGESLYLDIYFKGTRKTEFLGLYITKNDPERKNKKELAEKKRSQKELEIFANYNNLPNFSYGKEDFLKYYENKFPDVHHNFVRNLIKEFAKNKLVNNTLSFNKIDEKFCEELKQWLVLSEYKNNSVWVLLNRLKTVLNIAVKEKIIPFNPAKNIHIKKEETERVFLTFDELKKLNETECSNDILKKSFLFSCFTGLRLSDIRELTWSQIREGKIYFRQKKTKGVEYLPLSNQALKILDEIIKKDGEIDDQKVFDFSMLYSHTLGDKLRKWATAAKVNKEITFHSSRHTFATLSLQYGVDLFEVSKLLGHKSIAQTQIYAKIFNEQLNKAVNKLPNL